MVIDKKTKKIVCTTFTNGKRHDFRLFKESKVRIGSQTQAITDTGYQGLQKLHAKALLPKKKRKDHPLTPIDRKKNREISSQRISVENVIGMIKRFKIVAERYRNRRKRFGLRFNLIAAIYNLELFI